MKFHESSRFPQLVGVALLSRTGRRSSSIADSFSLVVAGTGGEDLMNSLSYCYATWESHWEGHSSLSRGNLLSSLTPVQVSCCLCS